jgi:serine protease Do
MLRPVLAAFWCRCAFALLAFVPCAHADLAAVIANAKASVVLVGTFRATDSPRFRLRGTGFIVSDGTLVVTNAHVLPSASEDTSNLTLTVQVRGRDKELQGRQATVLEVDKLHDLVLLKMSGAPGPAMVIGDSDAAREGQSVAFTGFPIGGALGFSPVTHRGMISSIAPIALPTANAQQLDARTISSLRSGSFDIFQLDATAYPGNSGGPMFDPDTGEVLGVINMVFVKGTRESALTNPSGISYAIPSKFIAQMLLRRK